jgi:hypothetical protein
MMVVRVLQIAHDIREAAQRREPPRLMRTRDLAARTRRHGLIISYASLTAKPHQPQLDVHELKIVLHHIEHGQRASAGVLSV